MTINKDYIVRIRRELHKVPEVGFHLPKSLAIIRWEVDAIGIPYTEEIGLPFASTHPCKMHACGHDCHTAMLLGTAKVLKEMTSDIHCCVKFIFQYAEEILGGAKTIFERAESMGGEDFAYFLQHKPGAMFQLGVGTEGKPIIPIHNGKMVVNEDGLDIAPQIFIQYILDQMER